MMYLYGMERGYIPNIGDTFGYWTVLDDTVVRLGSKDVRSVKCKCTCGTERAVRIHELASGGSVGCECVATRKNKARVIASGRLSKTTYSRIKKSAGIREIPFDVDMDYLWSLFESQKECCALSGAPLILETTVCRVKGESNITASLDRIDSSVGYTKNNVQWVHKDVNKMKQDLDEKRFKELCKMVALYD